ncbi:MAG: outer membrane beta-barrel protein [Sulfurovum sp.]|nr:outer membrane beta-barrel protein [Sulfurovum sp.]
MKTKEMLVASMLLSSALYSGGDLFDIPTYDFIPEIEIDTQNFFIFAAGGMNIADVTPSLVNALVVFDDALNDEGTVWEIGGGYRHTENVFSTLSVQANYFDALDIYNYNASINYRFTDFFIMPYVGGVLGYSYLSWNEVPTDTTGKNVKTELSSSQMSFGVQAGADVELTDQFTLFAEYRYMMPDHIMRIYETSTINHNNMQTIEGGIRYEF